MKRYSCKLVALIFVGVLCFFSSCSKETYSSDEPIEGETGSASVVWDNSSYNVSYLMDISVAISAPSNDKGFYINFALENSEHPTKVLSLRCNNYLYGEKVDLTTNKYSANIEFKDGQKTYQVDGGSSRVKAGSYYRLTRKGNHIELVIDLAYSGDNGYEHTLKVKYGGELPNEKYLPTENWQNEPYPHYSFTYDEAQYNYWSFVNFASAPFSCDIVNKSSRGYLVVWPNNFKYGEKVDLSKTFTEIRLDLSKEIGDSGKYENEQHDWYGDAILEGSYLYIIKGESSQYEATLDARCKDEDGTIHHIQAEYNIYK